MEQGTKPDGRWQARVLKRNWPFGASAMRPADVGAGLTGIMLSHGSLLEDVTYAKVAPNHYIVEVDQENYRLNYQPILGRIVQQWTEQLLRRLMTANSRLGRKEYRFGGRVRVEIRPVTNLDPSQARVLFRVEQDEAPATGPNVRGAGAPCLEMISSGRRYVLSASITTIGRDAACDIVLDHPTVLQARLVSGRHAYIRQDGGRWLLFDGAPYGRPSLNGTFVNRRPVPPNGYPLQEGDIVLLAALDPNDPRPDLPGVVTFRYHSSC